MITLLYMSWRQQLDTDVNGMAMKVGMSSIRDLVGVGSIRSEPCSLETVTIFGVVV